MSLRVNIVCRNWQADRILPRFARYLADGLGWTLTAAPVPPSSTDLYYLTGYFECQVFSTWPVATPTVSLFTHREEEPPGNRKTALYDAVAAQVQLRVSMCRLYGEQLAAYGPTIQPPLPVEQERFVIRERPHRARPRVGLSGYTYKNARKGEDLTNAIIRSKVGRRVEWTASGRGWPVPTRALSWPQMPAYFGGLDVLVCPSRVEGGPMTVLEALACGVSVVVPRGVGILDELPDVPGICRYPRGDAAGLVRALEQAAFPPAPVNRVLLRAAAAPYTVAAWCEGHRVGIQEVFGDAL